MERTPHHLPIITAAKRQRRRDFVVRAVVQAAGNDHWAVVHRQSGSLLCDLSLSHSAELCIVQDLIGSGGHPQLHNTSVHTASFVDHEQRGTVEGRFLRSSVGLRRIGGTVFVGN